MLQSEPIAASICSDLPHSWLQSSESVFVFRSSTCTCHQRKPPNPVPPRAFSREAEHREITWLVADLREAIVQVWAYRSGMDSSKIAAPDLSASLSL